MSVHGPELQTSKSSELYYDEKNYCRFIIDHCRSISLEDLVARAKKAFEEGVKVRKGGGQVVREE